MIFGALVFVQALVTVLESQARPRSGVDPAFVAEMQQAQYASGSRYTALTQPTRR
jgi:hypothetical protein